MKTTSELISRTLRRGKNLELTYIANARFPTEKAHGLQIAKTIDALQQDGVKVKLVVPIRRVSKRDRLPRAETFYNLKTRVRTLRLPNLDLLFLAQGRQALGRFLYLLQSLSFLFSATLYGLFHRSEIIYSRDPLLMLLFTFFHRNYFVELHTYPATDLGRKVVKRVLTYAKGAVVTNELLRNRVEGAGIKQNKILIAPNGADLALTKKMVPQTNAKNELGIPNGKKVVLYLGNFYRSKGVYVLAKAARKLPQQIMVFFVGGSRVDRNISPLKKYIRNHDIKNANVVEYQMRRNIPSYLSAADVCVLPNIVTDEESEYFTTPLKMFDYMVARRPIVASDLPALREILDDESALFVRPNYPQALAEGILSVLQNPIDAEGRANLAYSLAKGLSWENRARRIKKFIEASETHA